MNQSIKQLITCKWCQSIVDEPVVLPCSETVCKKHSIEISNTRCKVCDAVHVLRESEQFPANKVVQDLFKLKFKELDFGPNHKNASDRVNELKNFINDYCSLKEHPNEFIFEHFRKQRNNIDLAREKLFLDINQISDRLISEIDLQEKKCRANLLKFSLNTFSDNLASIKADLEKWEQDMKFLEVNDNLWTSISTRCNENVNTLKKSRMVFEERLLEKSFELKTELNLSDLFIKQLRTNEGILRFKIPNLSSYKAVGTPTVVKSTEVLFLRDLPLKIVVQFNPTETKDDIDVGILMYACLAEETYKSQDWKLEFGLAVAIISNAGSKVFKRDELSKKLAICPPNACLGWKKTLTLKKIMEDATLNAYNKEEDSLVVEIEVRLIDFKKF